MNSMILLIAILIPFLGGFLLFNAKSWDYKKLQIVSEVLVILTSLLVFYTLLHRPEEQLLLFQLTGNLKIILKLDGMGCLFAGLVAFLWPLANLYAFEYMAHDETRRHTFFGFYTMTYGVTLGIAFAGNILTLYFFYELLTLVTVYLVMHPMSKKAIRASRLYLYYSLGGAAFAFLSIICLTIFGDTTNFVLGGVLDLEKVSVHPNWVLTMFLLGDIYDDPAEQYLWVGMQTFHWIFHQRIAACYKKLGNIEECEKNIAEAYRLVSVVWKDFKENQKRYMDPFHQYLKEYDLAEYIK